MEDKNTDLGVIDEQDDSVAESTTEEVVEDSHSQAPEPKGDKVFISEEELKALEAKVKTVKDDGSKATYEEAMADLQDALVTARKEQDLAAEREDLKSVVDTLKEEIASLKEQSSKPIRRGVSHTPASFIKTDAEGKKGIPRDDMERLLKEVYFKK